MKTSLAIPMIVAGCVLGSAAVCGAQDVRTGSVVFLHPDGAGVNSWQACRMLIDGPDGRLAWDRFPHLGVYRGHMRDTLTATSHGGATTHAYGVKVPADSYGMDAKDPLTALSGFSGSIMQEALHRGKAAGVVNSGHIGEPGTGAFLSSSPVRSNVPFIAEQVLASGAQVILCGGERYMLPKGVQGVHGGGIREDGRNLIEEARLNGYTVVFTREELNALDLESVSKLLGVFAEDHTFNDLSDADLAAAGLPKYNQNAPTVAEMTVVALALLSRQSMPFLLVVEEEGSDNFANKNNASGTLEALRRADEAYAVAFDYLEDNPDTLLVTASDSDAGGMQVICPVGKEAFSTEEPLPVQTTNGTPLFGVNGRASLPFVSAPDRSGERFAFGVAFADLEDVAGGILARAAGLNAERLPLLTDNTDIYRLMYLTLFGEDQGLAR